jgi:hypothetical protein
MKFENSKYFELKHYKLEMPFGNFYLLETYFISEIKDGVHFDWEMIQAVMDEVIEFYGKNAKIGYISNRVNSYSMNPQTWNKVKKKYNMIVAGSIVAYNPLTYMNADIEKRLSTKTNIKSCLSLEEAVDWILNLKELN